MLAQVHPELLHYVHVFCVFSQLEYYLQQNYFIQMLVGSIQMEQKQLVCNHHDHIMLKHILTSTTTTSTYFSQSEVLQPPN